MESPRRVRIIGCATVIEEIGPLLPQDVECQVLDFGLHVAPQRLKQALQEAVDQAGREVDVVLLGYGLCSMAVVGLRANGCTLVVPKVDDCIALFLGSQAAYRAQVRSEPGTYYLTKGWIEVGDTPFDEYDRLVDRYGEQKARWLIEQMLKNYTRLVFIETGPETDRYKVYARRLAARFGLRYETIRGSRALLRKLLFGPWDDGDFVVVPPGGTITYADFLSAEETAPAQPGGGVYGDHR